MEKITGPLSVHSDYHLRMSGLTQLYGSTTLVTGVMWSLKVGYGLKGLLMIPLLLRRAHRPQKNNFTV
ncbi:hypothetical protein SDJN02_25684, partial [Cucurbita argyrosperma subsp. argyrosperma]